MTIVRVIRNRGAVAPATANTLLGQIAASLSAGESAAGPSIAALGDGAGQDPPDARQTIQWGNRFHYDDVRGLLLLVGKDASAGSGTGHRSNNIYTAATDTWETSGRFHIDGSVETGHLYESFGYDPDEGTYYVGRWGAEYIQTWALGSDLDSGWGTTSTYAGHWMPDSTPQQVPLCWHPNLFGSSDGGLVIVRNVNQSTDMELLAWRKSTDTYHSISGTQHDCTASPQAGTAEYCRGGDFVIAGASFGNFYRLPAGSGGSLGTPVQVAAPPVVLRTPGSASATAGILIDDPDGSDEPFILEKSNLNTVWRFNRSNDDWEEMGYIHPLPRGSAVDDNEWYVASLRTLGTFLAASQGSTGTLMWRPA